MHGTAAPRRTPFLASKLRVAQLLDPLDVDQMLGAAHAGAHLDEDIGAAAERARILAVSFEDADRLIERAWSFVIDFVQELENLQIGLRLYPSLYLG